MEAGMSEFGLRKRSIDEDIEMFNSTLALAKRDDAIDENDMHEWSST
jgi:hypothetical protein